MMIERVHEHIIEELQQNTRTDTVFILTAIFLNLVTLAINASVASSTGSGTNWIEFLTFTALIIVVNFVVVNGLLKGKQMREKLITGLLKMYKDNNVDGYYNPTLLTNYDTRYNLFLLAVGFTGVVALVIPILLLGGH